MRPERPRGAPLRSIGSPSAFRVLETLRLAVIVLLLGCLAAILPELRRGHAWLLGIAAGAALALAVAWPAYLRRVAARQLASSEARLEALASVSSDVLVLLSEADPERIDAISYASPALRRLLATDEAPSRLRDVVHPEDSGSLLAALQALRAAELDELVVELRFGTARSGWRDVELRGHDHSADPDVGGLVCNLRDVTERNNLHAAVLSEAMLDPLTQVLNRAGFLDRLDTAARATADALLAVCDVEGVRSLSEYLGHDRTDNLLVGMAERLSDALEPHGAVVARIGDTEFAVLLPTPTLAPVDLAAVLRSEVQRDVAVGAGHLRIRAHVGVTQLEVAGDPVEALRDADVALAEARRDRAMVAVYEPGMRSRLHERIELEADLRAAIGTEQLEVHYQPVVSLADGSLRSVEALVRWRRPGCGLMPPDTFIPVAETTGLIVPLGSWVLEQACRQAAAWRGLGHELPVAVNVAAAQFEHPDFSEMLAATLLRADLPPRLLTIEVTESSLLQHTEMVAETLCRFRSLGIGVSLDDFGTGYSGLAMIHQLPLDTVKLDKSFTLGLFQDGRSSTKALLRSVTMLARSLQLSTVAEGIETLDQLHELVTMGVDRGQGYLFSRPLPADEITETWLLAPSLDLVG